MIETGKIINGDCIEVMKTLPEGSVDLVVTSPPYGVGIDYDVHEDDVEFTEYVEFAKLTPFDADIGNPLAIRQSSTFAKVSSTANCEAINLVGKSFP